MWLKDSRTPNQIPVTIIRPDEDEGTFTGIRCPLCGWRPTASSMWCCICVGTPEPLFEGCLTMWNTFTTGGLCPGCSHQWQWTSCLQCHEASRHVDWYEEDSRPS